MARGARRDPGRMEATGVYWKPVWAVLATQVELVLANAAHVRNVPGRKTDVNDATWLADLLAHGLIRASFVPGEPIQALRDLTRTRKQLTREKAAHAQRIDKLLQAANLRLGTVLPTSSAPAGAPFSAALAAGETDPERLADRVQTRIRASRQQVVEALRGRLAELACCRSTSTRSTPAIAPSARSMPRSTPASTPFTRPPIG